jgi:hypothetical protein
MSDDVRKPGTHADGDDPEAEPNESRSTFLDRDPWYEDEPSEADAAVTDETATMGAAPEAVDEPAVDEPEPVDEPVTYEEEQDAFEAVAPSESERVEEPYEAVETARDEQPPVEEAEFIEEEQEAFEATTPEPDPYDFGEVPAAGQVEEPPELEFEPEPLDEEPPSATVADGAVAGAAAGAGIAGIGAGWNRKVGSVMGRYLDPLEEALLPTRGLVETTTQRAIIGLALLVALISLLADNSGFALLALSFVVPLLIVLSVMRQDVFETEPPLLLFGVGAVGLVAGLLLGWLGAWVVEEQWIDIGTLNFGAAGYGGIFADFEGNADVLVWLVNGLVLPLVALAAIIAVPIALRRYPQFRNEIMDGAILGAIGAAGYALGTAIIFLGPGIADGLPHTTVSDWTLMTFALIAVRPVILVLGGAMLGIAIWRYMRNADLYGLILPSIGSIGAWLLLALGSIQLQPAGLSIEFLWNLVLAVGVFILYRRSVVESIDIDRSALGVGGGRIVCPNCRKVTPVGAFCANCGEPLT